MNPVDLAAWVARSCEAQGVPVKVTDPVTLRDVVVLLGGSGGGASRVAASGTRVARLLPRGERRGPAALALSQTPDETDSFGSEAWAALQAGPDADVVNDGPDDCLLAG